MIARIEITETQQKGSIFVPMHWNEQYASHGRVGTLVNPVTDPLSMQPESKHTPVRIQPYPARWHSFILSRHPVDLDHEGYWVKANGDAYFRYELAGEVMPDSWLAWIRQKLPGCRSEATVLQEYSDPALGVYRAASIVDNRLDSVIFIAPSSHLPERNWLCSLFEQPILENAERLALLTGRPALGTMDVGPIVCSCFNIGEKTIRAAIMEKKLKTHQDVGQYLKAGSNCGSCIPEIKALL